VAFLLDTNVPVRFTNSGDSMHAVAVQAVLEIHRQSEVLHITPQNLIEFRSVATRAAALNGLGMAIADAEAEATRFEASFPLLPDTPDIYPAWKSLVTALGVIGKPVHDARLVAVCHVHGVTHLLTFNTAHFAAFSSYGPGLVVVDATTI
jgi:predicted nucleic acid-binding protein